MAGCTAVDSLCLNASHARTSRGSATGVLRRALRLEHRPGRSSSGTRCGSSAASSATKGERGSRSTWTACPAPRFFPDARLNFAENVLREDGRAIRHHLQVRRAASTADDVVERAARARPRRSPRRCARPASSPATASPPTCRTSPRRSSPCSAPRRSARSGRRARRISACRGCSTGSARSSRGS